MLENTGAQIHPQLALQRGVPWVRSLFRVVIARIALPYTVGFFERAILLEVLSILFFL